MLILFAISSNLVLANDSLTNKALQNEKLITEAKSIAKRFGSTLKPQLKQALQSGGFTHAVKVCSVKAPEIAQQLSAETGWQVKRVSLKPRNSSTAITDDWENQVLNHFEQLQVQGSPIAKLAYSENVSGEFRFMKAQGAEPLCLNCHGTNIQPAIKDILNQLYPDDKATGYRQGQIRGAISLTKSLSN